MQHRPYPRLFPTDHDVELVQAYRKDKPLSLHLLNTLPLRQSHSSDLDEALRYFQHAKLAPSQKSRGLQDYPQLLRALERGKSLTPKQLAALQGYYKQLGPQTSPALKPDTYALPKIQITRSYLIRLKNHLERLLHYLHHGIRLRLTLPQYQVFRMLLMPELIFYHMNPATFFCRGTPHVDFFQWSRLYGLVNFEALSPENDWLTLRDTATTNLLIENKTEQTLEQSLLLEENLLVQNEQQIETLITNERFVSIYLEDRAGRLLEDCVKDYEIQHALQNTLIQPAPTPRIILTAPHPTLSLHLGPQFS